MPLLRERELLPYLDLAYQGFGDGIADDAYAVRALAAARDRAGPALLLRRQLVLEEHERVRRALRRAQRRLRRCRAGEDVLGQLKFTVRRNYSSPPIHGGQIVAAGAAGAPLRREWEAEVAAMRERILAMRRALHDVLVATMPGRDFAYFLHQRGMFSYTGLSPRQVDRLREEYAVYLVRSGRMCVAGLNRGNVDATARAMAAVLAD